MHIVGECIDAKATLGLWSALSGNLLEIVRQSWTASVRERGAGIGKRYGSK